MSFYRSKLFWTGKNCFGWVLIDLVPIVLMGQNYFGPDQIRLIDLDLPKTIWIQPKRIGPVQIDWHLTKLIWTVKTHFGPIEGKNNNMSILLIVKAQNVFNQIFKLIHTSTLNQMQNVIKAATSCSQKWSFNCKSDYRIRTYYVHSRISTNKKGTHINMLEQKYV